MRAFSEFRHVPPPFWAMVKYISETLGYTIRGQGLVRTYSIDEIDRLVSQNGITVDRDTIVTAKSYFDRRADLLNNFVSCNLMDADTAREAFFHLYPLHQNNHFLCKLPMNKQKGAMKQVAFFRTCIHNRWTPSERSFFRHTTSISLEIRQDSRGKFPCLAGKILAHPAPPGYEYRFLILPSIVNFRMEYNPKLFDDS